MIFYFYCRVVVPGAKNVVVPSQEGFNPSGEGMFTSSQADVQIEPSCVEIAV